jgi:hypothetical protein
MGLLGDTPTTAHPVALFSRRAVDLCRVGSCLCRR